MNYSPEKSIVELLEFRDLEFSKAIELGRIALELLDSYRKLAIKAAKENPLALSLPDFTMSLMDHEGAMGAVETAVKNELESL